MWLFITTRRHALLEKRLQAARQKTARENRRVWKNPTPECSRRRKPHRLSFKCDIKKDFNGWLFTLGQTEYEHSLLPLFILCSVDPDCYIISSLTTLSTDQIRLLKNPCLCAVECWLADLSITQICFCSLKYFVNILPFIGKSLCV